MKNCVLPPGVPVPAGASVTPGLAAATAERLREAQAGLLALETKHLMRAAEETIAEWLAPASKERRAAEEAFSAATGIPAATAPFRPLLEGCRGKMLRRWVESEVRPLRALDPGADPRVSGPALTVHVLPGNVPLVWLPAFFACLLTRSPCLLKPAADDPATPALFVETLVGKLPELAPALAVLPWQGGDEGIEGEVMARAAAVIAYGGDETVASLGRRVPAGVRWIGHGARSAAGVIGRDAARPRGMRSIAAAVARDVLEYDGRGCLSLTTVFVERGGSLDPRGVAAAVVEAVAVAAVELPPGRPDRDLAALTQGWRGRMRARELAGKPGFVAAGARGLEWTVCYDEELSPPGLPLVRTLWVSPLADVSDLPGRLAALGTPAHALGYAGARARRAAAERLGREGVTRVCPFGEMQRPPLDWAPGGESWFARLTARVSTKSKV